MRLIDKIKGFIFGHSPLSIAESYLYHTKFSSQDGCFIAICPKFKGLVGYGTSHSEALKNIKLAVAQTIEEYLEAGYPIP